MSWFLGGLAFLALGQFAYGRHVERPLPPDDRKTPCVKHPDGVDYVPLPAAFAAATAVTALRVACAVRQGRRQGKASENETSGLG